MFPNDYGIRIFFQQDGAWLSIPDLVESPSSDMITLNKISDYESDAVVFIRPDYKGLTERPSVLRILFSAYLCKNGTPAKELTGDYIDIEIP